VSHDTEKGNPSDIKSMSTILYTSKAQRQHTINTSPSSGFCPPFFTLPPHFKPTPNALLAVSNIAMNWFNLLVPLLNTKAAEAHKDGNNT
jgi:hypothetical protein